jgi:hypothetical protein
LNPALRYHPASSLRLRPFGARSRGTMASLARHDSNRARRNKPCGACATQTTRPSGGGFDARSAFGNQALLRLARAATTPAAAGNGDTCGCNGASGSGTPTESSAPAIRRSLTGRVQRKSVQHAGRESAEPAAAARATPTSGAVLSPALHAYLDRSRSSARPLDPRVRQRLEPSFGRSLSGVRVVSDEAAAGAADQLAARAFTVGSHIWFARGEYRPHSEAGQRLIAHEVAHTLQQAAGAPPLQRALRIGESSAPEERAADRAADAALRGERVSLPFGSGWALRRQLRPGRCTTMPVSGRPDQREMLCSSGRYRVTLTTSQSTRSGLRTDVNAGYNAQDVWLDIRVCEGGTQVLIRPRFNLPDVIAQALGAALTGSPSSGVTLRPGLEIVVHQDRSFRIVLRGDVELNTGPGGTRVQSGGGGVEVETGVGTFGGGVRHTPAGPGPGGTTTPAMTGLVLEYREPAARVPEVNCPPATRTHLVFRCEQLHVTPARPAVPAVTHQERARVFLLYPYRMSSPVTSVLLERGGSVTAVDASDPAAVRALAGEGFRIVSIEGFTSPEGPRGPARTFVGNDQLSQDRADSAATWFAAHCPDCIAGSAPTPAGLSELYSPPPVGSNEVRGVRLERHAISEFLAQDPLAPQGEQERQRFGQMTHEQQRDAVYRDTRRAVVTLERTVTDRPAEPAVERSEEWRGRSCPTEVLEAARAAFGNIGGPLSFP